MKKLNIIVCIKQVPDPEGPASSFEIDSEAKKVIPVGIPPVINPYDENALEAAVRIKEHCGERLTAISMVEKPATAVLKKALTVGVDELFLLKDDKFSELDSYSTACVLSTAIKKIGEYNLILTGRQSADWGFGQVGLMIAEILQIPSISMAQDVSIENNKVVVKKLKRSGYEIVRAIMPALITASSEIGDLRLPSIQAIKEAKNKPVTVWDSSDLDIDFDRLNKVRIEKLVAPPSRARDCIFIEGESSEEKAEGLVIRLRQDKVI